MSSAEPPVNHEDDDSTNTSAPDTTTASTANTTTEDGENSTEPITDHNDRDTAKQEKEESPNAHSTAEPEPDVDDGMKVESEEPTTVESKKTDDEANGAVIELPLAKRKTLKKQARTGRSAAELVSKHSWVRRDAEYDIYRLWRAPKVQETHVLLVLC